MTEERVTASSEARAIIRAAERRAFAWGFLPLPLVDVAAVTYTQLGMIGELAAHYGVPYSEDRARPILTALLGSLLPAYFGGNLAYSLLRSGGVGRLLAIVSLPTSFGGATRIIGKLFAEHFHAGGTLEDFDLVTLSTPPRATGPTESTKDAERPERPDRSESHAGPRVAVNAGASASLLTDDAREHGTPPSEAEVTDQSPPDAEPRARSSTTANRLAHLEGQVARIEATINTVRVTVERALEARGDVIIAAASNAARGDDARGPSRNLDATLVALRSAFARVASERATGSTETPREDIAALSQRIERIQRSLDAVLARAGLPQDASHTQLDSIRRCMTDREVLVDVLESAVSELRDGLARSSESR